MNRTTSDTGINLIKKWEGCKLTAYKCPAGVWTIGYGHTSGVKQGMTITQAQATAYLREDLARFEKHVNSYNNYGWNQNEFDALVSFAFNIGNIKQLTADGTRSRATIAAKIPEYCKAGGKVLTGLVNRRKEEQALFLQAVGSGPGTGSTPPEGEDYTYRIQVELNRMGANLAEDNIAGSKTIAALPILRRGAVGEIVVLLQQGLVFCGHSCGKAGADGNFGRDTETAVKAFQAAHGLTVDGVAGPKTWSALIEAVMTA